MVDFLSRLSLKSPGRAFFPAARNRDEKRVAFASVVYVLGKIVLGVREEGFRFANFSQPEAGPTLAERTSLIDGVAPATLYSQVFEEDDFIVLKLTVVAHQVAISTLAPDLFGVVGDPVTGHP